MTQTTKVDGELGTVMSRSLLVQFMQRRATVSNKGGSMNGHLSLYGRGTVRLACLVALTFALLGLMEGRPAAAATISATPSSTEPYRACPVATPGHLECEEIVEPAAYDLARSALGKISPEEEGTGELGGWSPANLKSAYKLPATGGVGETVAIVDAWNYPDAEADLKFYREHYKLYYKGTETACTRANTCFKKINQIGESSESETATLYPKAKEGKGEKEVLEKKAEVGWAKEMSLDLDMVSAVCPECKLLLVEANNEIENSEKVYNLNIAENEAASLKPAVISNSWGSEGEYSSQTGEDVYYNHPGVPIVFSGGDKGYGPKYPATSPYVISAGGTQLKQALNTRKWSEEVWHNEPEPGDSTGSGCSQYEEKPSWQTDGDCSKRTENDVSAVAYNLSAYDSDERTTEAERWKTRTGTSASTPIIAGIDALASSATKLLGADAFYKKPGMLFDITVGNDGTCTPPAEKEYLCTAEMGYDGPTGSGTPDSAFESIVPGAATGLVTKAGAEEATLNGIVNPNGLATKFYFEYGTTKSYGTKTAEVSAGSGTSDVEESKVITSLTENAKYHFRLVTVNSDGTSDGLDQVFSTPLVPPKNTVLPVASPETPDQAVPEATTTGTWTGVPTGYEYQWERCNTTGGECGAIAGATNSKYTPVEADVEHTLVVKVTAKNAAGSNSARSKATNKVKPIGQITEYSLPAGSDPFGITAGPDGNLWFTDCGTGKIGKITTSGTITEYLLPAGGCAGEITAGPDGDLWFTNQGAQSIGKITTSGTVTEYALPANSDPEGITAGPDGNLWFADVLTSKVGKITTSGTVTEYALPAESYPEEITAGPDKNLWFTTWQTSKIGKITTSGTITEYSLPAASYPYGITTGPDGDLWFTKYGNRKIGKITTSGTITEYTARPPGEYSRGIIAGPDGNLWFTSWFEGTIGRITTSGAVTEYALANEESDPTRIAVGADDNVWFTENETNKIGKITP
jgi:virginiamycin B lyase